MAAVAAPAASARCRTAGCSATLRMAALIRSCTARGVPAGAAKANQASRVKPGSPASAVVGTSGRPGARRALAMASAFTRPPCTSEMAEEGVVMNISTRPPATSCSAGAAPR